MQHPVHVRLAVRASNQIDTLPVNPTYCQNWDIDSQTTTDLSFCQHRLRPRRSRNVACSPRNDSLLRTALALQHLAHVRLAVWASNHIDTPRLTQRTVKTGISIYQRRRSSNAACSSRNDSLLRTALALQYLAHVRRVIRASNQIDVPPPG